MPTSTSLTTKQGAFLAGYLPDIFHAEHAWLEAADRDRFVAAVSAMDFDGQCEAAEVRIARNLHAKGVFTSFDVHYDVAGQPCIYVQFNDAGAHALFDVMHNGTRSRDSATPQSPSRTGSAA